MGILLYFGKNICKAVAKETRFESSSVRNLNGLIEIGRSKRYRKSHGTTA